MRPGPPPAPARPLNWTQGGGWGRGAHRTHWHWPLVSLYAFYDLQTCCFHNLQSYHSGSREDPACQKGGRQGHQKLKTQLLLPAVPPWAHPQQVEGTGALFPTGHSVAAVPAPWVPTPNLTVGPFRTTSLPRSGPLWSSGLLGHPPRPLHTGPHPGQPSRGPSVSRGGNPPYLVVQSCRAGGGQGLGQALLQGQPVAGIGGGSRRLSSARRVLGGTRPVLASWQVLLPWINLRKRRGQVPRGQVSGKPAPGGMRCPPRWARPVLSHGCPSSPRLWMQLGTREAPTLTSLE